MSESCVAIMLENTIWFYKDGKKIYKIHAVGRKIIHHLINPEYNIHVNEVGATQVKMMSAILVA